MLLDSSKRMSLSDLSCHILGHEKLRLDFSAVGGAVGYLVATDVRERDRQKRLMAKSRKAFLRKTFVIERRLKAHGTSDAL
jgi:hypothetical protein